MRVGTNSAPKVDASAYRWLCSYTDAQMRYPERFVLALIEDARQLAEEQGAEFRVFPYHRARRDGQSIAIERIADEQIIHQWNPPIVVNATGAWGDATLEQLEVDANRLFGGTKGSHFVTHAKRLREAIGNAGVYAEAEDGRLVFVLPFGDAVLVGTTDEFFDESPERAAATESELEYLLELTNALFEGLDLTLADVDMHYSGVRPLPCAAGGKTASVSRDHFIDERRKGPLTVLTLIGGKLTTARAFAELAAERVLGLLGQDYTTNSRTRAVPGGRDYPASATAVLAEHQRVAEKFQLSPAQIAAMWSLWGNRVEQILDECQPLSTASLSGTEIPLAIVRWIIQREWVTSLEDLIERRLMLVYHAGLTRDCLCELAGCLVEANLLEPANVDAAIVAATNRLSRRYGKTVTE
jgi:glycerol-3-phosphate dehydrogenase